MTSKKKYLGCFIPFYYRNSYWNTKLDFPELNGTVLFSALLFFQTLFLSFKLFNVYRKLSKSIKNWSRRQLIPWKAPKWCPLIWKLKGMCYLPSSSADGSTNFQVYRGKFAASFIRVFISHAFGLEKMCSNFSSQTRLVWKKNHIIKMQLVFRGW